MGDQVSITYLRDNLKAVLQKVKKGSTITITDHSVRVAEFNPPRERTKAEIEKEIEKIRAGSFILGDIISPVISEDEILLDWNNLDTTKNK